MIDDYFAKLGAVIAASTIVRSSSVTFDRRSDEIGYVRGDLFLIDDSRLHFREFVRQVGDAPAECYTYAYHYQRADGTLILRYDDAPHFPDLPNAPHHKHADDESNVISATLPDLATVLREIESLVA